MIGEEVLDMITTASYNTSRQAHIAMPKLRCADASWLRALSPFMGEVSVMTVADRDRCAITAVRAATDQLVPGASAWSPPT